MNQKLTEFEIFGTEERIEESKIKKTQISEGMKKLWEHLKKKGLFSAFTSYESFRQKKGY